MMDKEKYNNAEDVLEQIIYLAYRENDVAEFGINVANVLYGQGYIDNAIHELLAGK